MDKHHLHLTYCASNWAENPCKVIHSYIHRDFIIRNRLITDRLRNIRCGALQYMNTTSRFILLLCISCWPSNYSFCSLLSQHHSHLNCHYFWFMKKKLIIQTRLYNLYASCMHLTVSFCIWARWPALTQWVSFGCGVCCPLLAACHSAPGREYRSFHCCCWIEAFIWTPRCRRTAPYWAAVI